jgi:glutathionyl-hydroquinone reductase
MGMLLEGKWIIDDAELRNQSSGKFIRSESFFRNFIGFDTFPAEPDRYHIYISHACPWANRTAIVLKLKGLEEVISISSVMPLVHDNGWKFGQSGDPLYGKQYAYELYQMAQQDYSGRVTVPILWDKKLKIIVNNESSEIIRMLNNQFEDYAKNAIDLYPVNLRKEIDKINDFVYDSVNNGVYKAGFATTQVAYEDAVYALFDALDVIEGKLEDAPYLCGDQITEADVRLFTTLIRFDIVYYSHFKCNLRHISDYPNLNDYLGRLMEKPEFSSTIYPDEIKQHYFGSHKQLNPSGIIPAGPMFFDI